MEISIPEREPLSRRDWICRVMQVAGTGILTQPLLAQEHEHETATNLAAPDSGWRPIFLSREQNSAVVALGEGLIPGSKESSCNRVIDLVLSIESEKNKTGFLDALAAFDSAARKLSGRSLADLPTGGMNDLLTKASAPADPLRPHFDLLKEWLADTYWSSQQGCGNWVGQAVSHGPALTDARTPVIIPEILFHAETRSRFSD